MGYRYSEEKFGKRIDELRKEAESDPLGLMKRIGCRSIIYMKYEQQRIIIRWAGTAAWDYLKTLQKTSPSLIQSQSVLPHPAHDIEAALFVLLLKALLEKDTEKVAFLRRGISVLSRFVMIPGNGGEGNGLAERDVILSDKSRKEAERLCRKEKALMQFTVCESEKTVI